MPRAAQDTAEHRESPALARGKFDDLRRIRVQMRIDAQLGDRQSVVDIDTCDEKPHVVAEVHGDARRSKRPLLRSDAKFADR